MKSTLLVGIAVSALLLAGCSSDSETADEVAITSVLTTTPNAPSLNKRGALEVAMGETATVTRNGSLVLEVSDTSLSTEGCDPHRKQPDSITKYILNATITTGNETSVQWLWPTDFYYVDATGKVTKNSDVTDTNPCAGGTSNSFIRTPTNSSADGRPTLDVPNGTVVIGYSNSTGPDARIEWRLTPTTPHAASPAARPEPGHTSTPTARATTASGSVYSDTCSELVPLFEARRELGGSDANQKEFAEAMIKQVQQSSEWASMSDGDRSEAQRGVHAAAAGSC